MKIWQKKVRTTCIYILIFSSLIRLGGSALAKMPESQKLEMASFLLCLETGQAIHPAPFNMSASACEIIPHKSISSHTEPVSASQPDLTDCTETPESSPAPLTFSRKDADCLEIRRSCTYEPDLGALLEENCDLDFSGDLPRILILHTHATEAYTPEVG